MKHRISAGALVVHENKILLVNHMKPGKYDFWVAPGGGIEGSETAESAAIRETKEETGLDIKIKKLVYIEELFDASYRICKLWFFAELLGGKMVTDDQSRQSEHIINISFFSPEDLQNLQVFPPDLKSEFWSDYQSNFPAPVYLGLREMVF